MTSDTGELRFAGSTGVGHIANAREASEYARQSETNGFNHVTAGDTQSIFRDCFCVLAACAMTTERVRLGTSVSNVSTRHPVVTASAIATVNEMSSGRAYLGVGTGASATANAGLPPASPSEFRSGIRKIGSALRQARDHDPEWPAGFEIDESIVPIVWVKRWVPIIVAAHGPKASRIAAELGDGVIIRTGDVPWPALHDHIAQLRKWRADGPRAADPFEVHLLLPTVITDDPAQGRRSMRAMVSARARSSTKPDELPTELRANLLEYQAGYRWDHHASSETPVNADALERLGLSEHMFDRYALIGDDDTVIAKLHEIEAAGVTHTGIGSGPEALRVLQRYRRQIE